MKVTLNAYTFRSTIASMGGTVCIPFRKSNREAANLEGGEMLEITLELDTEERRVDPPSDFASALKQDSHAWDQWRQLSYTHRREYVEAIEAAKKSETRERRIHRAISELAARKS